MNPYWSHVLVCLVFVGATPAAAQTAMTERWGDVARFHSAVSDPTHTLTMWGGEFEVLAHIGSGPEHDIVALESMRFAGGLGFRPLDSAVAHRVYLGAALEVFLPGTAGTGGIVTVDVLLGGHIRSGNMLGMRLGTAFGAYSGAMVDGLVVDRDRASTANLQLRDYTAIAIDASPLRVTPLSTQGTIFGLITYRADLGFDVVFVESKRPLVPVHLDFGFGVALRTLAVAAEFVAQWVPNELADSGAGEQATADYRLLWTSGVTFSYYFGDRWRLLSGLQFPQGDFLAAALTLGISAAF